MFEQIIFFPHLLAGVFMCSECSVCGTVGAFIVEGFSSVVQRHQTSDVHWPNC